MKEITSPASIVELEARLSEYIALARRGEHVVITDGGAPVAVLGPLPGASRPDANVQQLTRAGLIRPPRSALPADFFDRPRPADPESAVLQALLEQRRETR